MADCSLGFRVRTDKNMEFRSYNSSFNGTEKEALVQFRKNLSDILEQDVTDGVLLKWLRAKNFNLRKSEKLYREHIWALKLFNLESFEGYKWPEVIEKFNFANPLGIAKDGSPIYYIGLGRGDLKGFLNSLDLIEIGKYSTYVIETDLKRCKKISKKLGKDINEITYIVDMEYFSLRQIFFQGLVESGFDLMQILQDHYPEIWNNILVVNVPSYFQTVFNVFKPIFRHTFVQKICVATRDRTASLLLKYIDAEELPAFLGGKRVDSFGNMMCNEFMKFGGIIPDEYYVRNSKPLLQATDPEVEDIWIEPKGFYNVPLVVRESNSVVTVELRSEGGSIGTRIIFQEFGADPEKPDIPPRDKYIDDSGDNNPWKRVSPFAHLSGPLCPVINHFYAAWPGIYVYKFDNSWNWLTGRRVIFRIKVLPPGSSPF